VRVLIVGSGGREHALAWKISHSRLAPELHAAPGNPGIASLGECHPVRADDAEGLLALAQAVGIDLAVIGPEAPLVAGVADELRHAGIAVFGPTAAAARIEGSKSFARQVMEAAGVPAAAALAIARPPCVVKADGLAGGKGVFVCRTQDELDDGLGAASALGGALVIEELLEGREVSLFVLTDGKHTIPLAAARDYKRAGDGDTGPNTGGMGAYSPVPELDASEVAELVERIHRPVLEELARRRTPFAGLLYAGLMLTEDGPRVLEFNCRFGDPETQSVLPRVRGDLLEALAAAAAGDLAGVTLETDSRAAVTVVVAAAEYPERGDTGSTIEGIAGAEALGALVFHAGTALRGERLVTSGGRILDVTGVADDLDGARALAYGAAARISFDGARYRRDIAALEGSRVG
jgi:phosphoribosylamine--glycine ligase